MQNRIIALARPGSSERSKASCTDVEPQELELPKKKHLPPLPDPKMWLTLPQHPLYVLCENQGPLDSMHLTGQSDKRSPTSNLAQHFGPRLAQKVRFLHEWSKIFSNPVQSFWFLICNMQLHLRHWTTLSKGWILDFQWCGWISQMNAVYRIRCECSMHWRSRKAPETLFNYAHSCLHQVTTQQDTKECFPMQGKILH